ncbi:Rv1733c family protein [Streptomyces scopuliridis]|uniref:Rv1733c family protein n=1 Tax=Streptomyces scopuliridis TaxID=452529 RepID=UPI00342F38AE
MGIIVGLWRWRHNPLCRGTDLVEAWVALTAVLLFALATPAVGWICGNTLDTSLRNTARVQHEQRHRTNAVVVERAADHRHVAYDAESLSDHASGTRVTATWSAADGSARTGTVTAPLRKPRAGDTFSMWTDQRTDKQVRGPMNATSARVHAVLAGFGATVLAVGLVECARRLIIWRLVQRRYQRLDRAWAATGPDWGRTGAGS